MAFVYLPPLPWMLAMDAMQETMDGLCCLPAASTLDARDGCDEGAPIVHSMDLCGAHGIDSVR